LVEGVREQGAEKDQINKRWAGHAACVGKGEVRTGFGWENLRERDHLGDLVVGGKIIRKLIFKKWEWIDLAQDRDRWRALVNEVMNMRVPQNAGIFLTS
jgi:hypothetical protein